MEMPMPARRVVADRRVADDRGKVAIERGPLVYCVEGTDEPVHPWQILLPEEMRPAPEMRQGFIEGHDMVILTGKALTSGGDTIPLTMIPYYAWDHRGNHGMRVWLPVAE
jgi:DUF1680 family protein